MLLIILRRQSLCSALVNGVHCWNSGARANLRHLLHLLLQVLLLTTNCMSHWAAAPQRSSVPLTLWNDLRSEWNTQSFCCVMTDYFQDMHYTQFDRYNHGIPGHQCDKHYIHLNFLECYLPLYLVSVWLVCSWVGGSGSIHLTCNLVKSWKLVSLSVAPKLNMSVLLPQKRVGLHTFFLPAFFTLYKLVQAGTRYLKKTVIWLMLACSY